MEKIVARLNYRFLLFLAVFLFLFILRAHSYDRLPTYGHLEELQFGWAGMYLIETGIPVSWNPNPREFEKKNIIYSGPISDENNTVTVYTTLIKPYLDEPPLFSLITGYSAHLFGANREKIIPAAYLRLPSIFLSAATTIFVFLIAKKLFGFATGILAMLFFGTIPIFVFSSRFAVPENLIATFYLASIYFLLLFIDKPTFLKFVPLLVLPGLAGLAKPTGYFIAPLLAFWLFYYRFKKLAFLVLAAVIPAILAYFAYGIYFSNWEYFRQVFLSQGSRPASWSALGFLISSPGYDIFEFFDGWYIFFLLATIYFLLVPIKEKSKEIKFVALAAIFWILVVIFSGGAHDLFPWYRIPAFGPMAILGTLALQEIIKKPDFFKLTLVAGMLFASRTYLSNPFKPNVDPWVFRLSFLALTLPSLGDWVFRKKILEKISVVTVIAIIAIGVFLNSKVIYSYFDISCESITCPFGPSNLFAKLYFPIIWRFLAP